MIMIVIKRQKQIWKSSLKRKTLNQSLLKIKNNQIQQIRKLTRKKKKVQTMMKTAKTRLKNNVNGD